MLHNIRWFAIIYIVICVVWAIKLAKTSETQSVEVFKYLEEYIDFDSLILTSVSMYDF